MKNEMDVLNMDERQRLAWLLANRLTLILVGVTWLGMIAWELMRMNTPWFLIVMVPVFGVTRFVCFKLYARTG